MRDGVAPARRCPSRRIRLLVYGTLLDPDLRGWLCGRGLTVLGPGLLAGYRVCRLAGVAYPGLKPAPGATARGLVLEGVAPRELLRLRRYEGSGYRLLPVRVLIGGGIGGAGARTAAHAFVGTPGVGVVAGVWRLDHWQRRDKRGTMAAFRRARRAGPAGRTR